MENQLIYERPLRCDYGIGIIGTGGIVNHVHLPAYRKAGLNVVAVTDIDRQAAERTADKFGIGHVFSSVHELVAADGIDIVDIAIPPQGRLEIVEAAAKAGKHILIQKPFAHNREEAERMVRIAQDAGVKLMVNQNARYAPFYRKTKELIETGAIGVPYLFTHEMRINQDKTSKDSWFAKLPHFLIADYDIHHLDMMRFWAGRSPERIFSSTARMEGQHFLSDMTHMAVLEFSGGLRGHILSVDSAQMKAEDQYFRFVVEGSEGRIECAMNNLYHVLDFRYVTNRNPDEWVPLNVEGQWFPDAFYGVMFELMNAIHEDREPAVSGSDNLETLRLLEGAISSVTERRVVEL
ncbi:Gfo/Idh/MocA family protein [Paenibacillus silvisoli]|uniref:Gfo/Idh/MocA family protein n=1 Tax=Paenibacillus silvisoli TaxID=3110539 RepID=UPI00280472B9|nr:Gfo/Idh/MocA family oxidoreductase [Paenibacillus silvisoli]